MYLIKKSPFLHNIFSDGSILAANKRCQNLKDLLVRGDTYNIKHDWTYSVPHQYKPCGKKCDSCDNFVASQSHVISNATGRTYYILRDSTCSKCCIYGILHISTISWKPRLGNYKSHSKNVRSCKIAIHFIDICCDEELTFRYLAFVIIDVVNNTSGLTRNQIEDILLEKEKF